MNGSQAAHSDRRACIAQIDASPARAKGAFATPARAIRRAPHCAPQARLRVREECGKSPAGLIQTEEFTDA